MVESRTSNVQPGDARKDDLEAYEQELAKLEVALGRLGDVTRAAPEDAPASSRSDASAKRPTLVRMASGGNDGPPVETYEVTDEYDSDWNKANKEAPRISKINSDGATPRSDADSESRFAVTDEYGSDWQKAAKEKAPLHRMGSAESIEEKYEVTQEYSRDWDQATAPRISIASIASSKGALDAGPTDIEREYGDNEAELRDTIAHQQSI